VEDGAPPPEESWLLRPEGAPADGPTLALDGVVLGRPWHLMANNAARLLRDIVTIWANEDHPAPPGVHRLGDGPLSLGAGAEIEPGVHVDTRDGPIRLEDGVRVQGPARLRGPLHVGADSVILGGRVGISTIGPVCKIHGEVTDSVILGYVNKAHDGHLGHAVLGRWVNLGAFTTNSDLKNNYGNVRVWAPDGDVDTGLMKVGCFVGDHVKTGIGTPINTGTVLGAGSNVFGGIMPPYVVPPFSWGSGSDLTDYRFDRFIEVAVRTMGRRDVELTPGVRRILEEAWTSARRPPVG
jgi:UDP-N-acetylglucosamine diphosphorylase/glucosamine-1-phosphate N-acetyltransferase